MSVSPEFVHGPVCLCLQLEGQLVDGGDHEGVVRLKHTPHTCNHTSNTDIV